MWPVGGIFSRSRGRGGIITLLHGRADILSVFPCIFIMALGTSKPFLGSIDQNKFVGRHHGNYAPRSIMEIMPLGRHHGNYGPRGIREIMPLGRHNFYDAALGA